MYYIKHINTLVLLRYIQAIAVVDPIMGKQENIQDGILVQPKAYQ